MLEVNRGNRWPDLKMVPSSSRRVLIPIIRKQHQKRINHLQWLVESICAGAESTRLSASHCEPQAELCWSTFEQPHTAHWTLFADDQKTGLETKRESIRENVEEPFEMYWMDLLVGQKNTGEASSDNWSTTLRRDIKCDWIFWREKSTYWAHLQIPLEVWRSRSGDNFTFVLLLICHCILWSQYFHLP